jgi:putative ABC transport system substrate-binding protein
MPGCGRYLRRQPHRRQCQTARKAVRIQRREFISTLGGAVAWPLAGRAQQPAQIPQVGWIWPGAAAGNPTLQAGSARAWLCRGKKHRRRISLRREQQGTADLARLNVGVIVAVGNMAVRAVRRAAPDTPIVFLDADPIGNGLVTNLSRPGGNITGVSVMRLGGKWPELAKEALPALTRIGYLINNASSATNLGEARRSTEALDALLMR